MPDSSFRVIEAIDGRAVLECEIVDALRNRLGSLHGGVIATLVDDAGTEAISSADIEGRTGVTTDLGVSYFASAREGVVTARAQVLKSGKTMAFVSVDVLDASGRLLAQGRMTKFMPAGSSPS
jgi:acyl-coenzyme A thioesterase 13